MKIYIYVYILSEPQKYYATKTRTMLEHPRTALGSHWILGTISVRTPISYLHWMPEWWIEVDGGWRMEGPEKSSTCCRRQPLLILLTHLSQFPFTVCRRAR